MQKYLVWIASALVSLVMLAGGAMKLTGQEQVLVSFNDLGLPSAFALFIGAAEVAGGICIWLKRLSSLAAAGICLIRFGALYYHASFTPLEAGIPALVVFLGALYVLVRRLPDSFWKQP